MEKEYEVKYKILINYLKETIKEIYISEKNIKFILKILGEIEEEVKDE